LLVDHLRVASVGNLEEKVKSILKVVPYSGIRKTVSFCLERTSYKNIDIVSTEEPAQQVSLASKLVVRDCKLFFSVDRQTLDSIGLSIVASKFEDKRVLILNRCDSFIQLKNCRDQLLLLTHFPLIHFIIVSDSLTPQQILNVLEQV
jgi:hypothetical protein